MPSRSTTTPSSGSGSSPLLTEDQLALERSQAALLARPEIAAAHALGLQAMRADPLADTADGARLMENALDRWLSRLCLMSLMQAESRPVILWCNQLTSYERNGLQVPASAAAIDTPDFIYRFACIDGTQTHRLRGRAAAPAARLLLQITDDHPGSEGFVQPKDGSDLESLGIFDVDEFCRESDGAFEVVLGPAGSGAGRAFVAVPPRRLQLIFRDVLNDWNENIHALAFTRATGARSSRPPTQALARRIAEDFPALVAFWLRLKDRFRGLPEANRPYGPTGRSGNWGLSLIARFDLAPDEALIVTIANVEARYFGVQIADVWMMLPDPKRHTGSFNRAQSYAAADGSLTYILSQVDPGLANWLDTAGSREGYLLFRWISPRIAAGAATMVRRFEVVKLAEIPARLSAHARMSAEMRKTELARRNAQWSRRVADA